ncbi:unnamed protein product [Rotaria sp. Silwood2]|nr:unnamed protein product [Rotaria sp. Silwood2]CAF4065185.1 unnamed protein product [Rotaria sp. Silwood2]
MAAANNNSTKSSKHKPLICSSQKTASILSTIKKFLLSLRIEQQSTVENFIIIWLDTNIDIHTDEYNSIKSHFQNLVHLILPFNDSDRCIDFITDTKNEKIFLIMSGLLGRTLAPVIHDFSQIDSIYIYCNNRARHEKWADKEKKIKGVFQDIGSIYDAVRRDKRQCEDNLSSFSILSSTFNKNKKLNQLDQLFIYTHLLKDILIELEYKPNTKIDFVNFCCSKYQNNKYQLDIIKEFKNDYNQSSSIWWYTRECFISSMLNKASRIQNMDILINMGFFIRDIHLEITRLSSKSNNQNRLIVYRGQGILEEEFHKILENRNGFLSFNNFLITTTDNDLSKIYARCARDNHELIGVLFQIEIDRTKSLFTPLDKISYYSQSEKEILFTTHTIFRIHTIDQIENGLWQIQLKLTTNENEQLKYFKHLLRKEIENKTGPERLNILMTKLQMFHGSKSIEKAQSTEMEFEQHVHENVYHKQTKKTSQSTVNNKMEQPVKESLCHEPTEKTGQLMANSETKQNVDENVYQRPTTGTSQSTAIDKIEQLVEENACHAQTRKKSELVANDEIEEHVEGKIRYEQTNEMSQSTATENIEQSFKENVCDEQTNEISQLTANSETKQNVDENVYHRPTTGTSQSTAIDKIEQPVEVKIHHEKSNETSQLTANSETKQNVGENVYPEQTKETSQSLFSDEIKLEHSPVVTDVIGEQPVNRLQSASDV